LFEAVVRRLWPAVSRVLPLQPQVDALTGHALGATGWTGVKAWCRQNTGKLDLVIDPGIGSPLDLLVIALDADIATEALAAEPHPASRSTHLPTRLRAQIQAWLGVKNDGALPGAVVVSAPTMAIEAWVVAALFPNQRAPEQLTSPAKFLVEKRQLAMDPRRPGKVKKPPEVYRRFAVELADNFDRVRRRCPEAAHTAKDIEELRAAVERRAR
jgi:hypothetical protein